MRTEIVLNKWEVEQIIKDYLKNKGYKLVEAYDMREQNNYVITMSSNEVRVVIGS
jgi:hypothetical protein